MGSTISTVAGVTATAPGGFLALSSDIGHLDQTCFAVVPELSLKAGYQIAPAWRLTIGYDVLYWTGVQRAGGLIDTTVNPNLTPPPDGGWPNRPAPVFNTTNLLAQGFSFGVRYNYWASGVARMERNVIRESCPRRKPGLRFAPSRLRSAYSSPSSLASTPFTARAQPASFRSRVASLMFGLKRCSSRQLSANFVGSG